MNRSLHIRALIVCAVLTAIVISGAHHSIAVERLVILHTNDIHGFLDRQPASWMNPTYPPMLGGAASVSTIIKDVRRDCRENGWGFLLIDSGDIYQGTPVGDKTKGTAVVKWFNAIGYDLWALGNHDFDDGVENARHLVEASSMPVISANIVDEETEEVVPWLKPFIIMDFDGTRVGITGGITNDMPSLVPQSYLKGIKFLPVAPTLSRYAEKLRNKGCDLVFSCTHIGFPHQGGSFDRHRTRMEGWMDDAKKKHRIFTPPFMNFIYDRKGYGIDDYEVGRMVKGIDLILGGHSHIGLSAYEAPLSHTIICQAYARLTCIGRMDLYLENDRVVKYDHQLITPMEENYWPDLEIQSLVEKLIRESTEGMDVPLGKTLTDLRRGDYETTLGNMITDSMREKAGADVAILNRGGIRANLQAGSITELDLYEVLPFGNAVVHFPVSGAELLEILEIGVSGRRRDTQFSGVKIRWNPTFPTGERICEAQVGDEPLDLEKTYIFTTSDYLAKGAIGYGMLEKISDERGTMSGTIRESVMDYVQVHTPLKISIEGRNRFSEMYEMSPQMKEYHTRIKERAEEETEEERPPNYYNL
jgi:2',3'-cyclic-nucleotide 2'-phosphodiesterase (5'-nucleotidase family)